MAGSPPIARPSNSIGSKAEYTELELCDYFVVLELARFESSCSSRNAGALVPSQNLLFGAAGEGKEVLQLFDFYCFRMRRRSTGRGKVVHITPYIQAQIQIHFPYYMFRFIVVARIPFHHCCMTAFVVHVCIRMTICASAIHAVGRTPLAIRRLRIFLLCRMKSNRYLLVH